MIKTLAMEFDLKFYENILNNIQDGIWVSNSEDIIFYANEAMARISGVPVDQIVGNNVFNGFPPETISEFIEYYKKAKITLQPVWYEVKVRTPSSEDTWQNGWILPQLSNGAITQIVTTIRNVTEKKLAEENLLKSEKENTFLANTALDLVNCKNLNEIYKYVAEQLYLLIGKEGIIIIADFDNRNNHWQVIAFEGLNRHLDKITKLVGFDLKNLKGNVKSKYYENIKNGKLTLLAADISELTDGRISKAVLPVLQKMISIKELYCITFKQNENIFGNVTFITNAKTPTLNSCLIEAFISQVSLIIEKQYAEKTLLESQQKLKNIVEYSTNMFFQHDTNHILTYLSPQVEDILGYNQEEALMNWTNLATGHPINETGFQLTLKAIETGVPQVPYELELKHKSGRKIWVEIREAPIVEQGKTVAIVGALIDITERKIAEQNLKRISKIFAESLNEIYVFDAKSLHFIEVNQAAINNIGYSLQELGRMTPIDIKPEVSIEEFQELIAPLINNEKEKVIFETTHQRKDQTTYPVEVHLQMANFDEQRVFIAFILDITQRRKAIEALMKSEMKYRLLVDDMYEGLMQTDFDDRIQFVNPRLCQMLSYKEEELIGKIGYETIIFEEDVATIMAKNRERARHKTDRYIIRLKRKDGDFIWTQISGSPIYNEAGEVVSTIGLVTDITQRKLAETELENHRNNLEILVKERTAEIEAKNKELERMNNLFVGREFRIKELRDKVRELGNKINNQ